jgi:hypothetical protein
LQCAIEKVHADVIFDHFSHQAVDRPPRSGDELQDVGTADFLREPGDLDSHRCQHRAREFRSTPLREGRRRSAHGQ